MFIYLQRKMRVLFLAFLLLASIVSLAQTNAGPDQSLCIGDTVQLQGTGQVGDRFLWTSDPPDNTISDPTILKPTVHPLVTTEYVLESRHVNPANLVVNGSFEDGNVGFISSYTYSPGLNGLWNVETYAITDDAHYNHQNFFCNHDHTTGSGQFMAVNGSQENNKIVWKETIQVSPDTEYEFSTWIESLSPTNPAKLQFSINGTLLGQPFNASSVVCQWNQFFEQWNSGSNTSAEISIVNKNTNGNGNDFALDDIKFAEVTYSYDTCVVTVYDYPAAILAADATVIPYETSTVLHGQKNGSPGPLAFNWDPVSKLTDPGSEDPTTTLLTQNTFYTYTVTDETSHCSSFDTITIKVTGGPLTITSLLALPDTICSGDSSTITINIEGGSGNYESTWTSDPPGFNHTGPESQITIFPTENTEYFVIVSDGFTTTPFDTIRIAVLPQIEIISQPVFALVEEGLSAVFKVEAINQLSFQWEVSNDGGSTWTVINDDATYSGAQTNELTVNNVSPNYNAYQYRCLLEGSCSPVYSSAAELIVASNPDVIGEIDDIVVCQNDTFSVSCNIQNFINIDSLYLTFYYDTTLLRFTNLKNIQSNLSDITYSQAGDSIIVNWDSNSGLSINDGALFSFVFIAKNGGEASVKWSSACTMKNANGIFPDMIFTSGQITITALPETPLLASVDPDSLSVLDEIDITLSAEGGSGEEIVWSADSCNGTVVGSETSLNILRPEQTTTYFVKWENGCGLSSCKQTTVIISHNIVFAVPNAFSPNGDGVNDEFGVVTPHPLPFFELYIYSRWGKLIFSSTNQDDKWDGTINGKPAPTGSYVWMVNYKFLSDGEGSELLKDQGTVTLIK
jgi:gliding motility-associated-like protein